MKAIVIHGPKDLRVERREPEVPGDGEVDIAIEAGGICGSDLHYFHDGGFGDVRLREPMVLGHEVAGRIVSTGADVEAFGPGDRVAVSPSRPCGRCEWCWKGMQNHCSDMRFYGSAMRMPHVQGAFRERLVAKASQCHRVADGVGMNEAAFAEPLAVTLHAARRAGPLFGRRVLITGCGPIGALAILSARAAGAAEITVTDIMDPVLRVAEAIGADRAINVASDDRGLEDFKRGKGAFDVMIEASGNSHALRAGLETLKPGGICVQLALGGEIAAPHNLVVVREVEIRGAFRFHEEFGQAVDLINHRAVDVRPLRTHTFAVDDAIEAFETASDRNRAMKVQIAFG